MDEQMVDVPAFSTSCTRPSQVWQILASGGTEYPQIPIGKEVSFTLSLILSPDLASFSLRNKSQHVLLGQFLFALGWAWLIFEASPFGTSTLLELLWNLSNSCGKQLLPHTSAVKHFVSPLLIQSCTPTDQQVVSC